jgi:hypothetical protein
MAGAAVLVALLAGCSGSGAPAPAGGSSPTAASTSAPATSPGTTPTGAATATGAPAATIQAVPRGELTGFRVEQAGASLIDAGSSGLARYNTSDRCEVPGQPCYDAPTLDQVARIDLGAAPTVPGTETTFVTGHSNRFHPDDPTRGVFSRLQEVRTGDTLVLTTTAGVFTYTVTTVLSVPFDRLTSTDEVVRVRPDTVVAISCVIAPDHASYLGNYVVVGTLRESAPR